MFLANLCFRFPHQDLVGQATIPATIHQAIHPLHGQASAIPFVPSEIKLLGVSFQMLYAEFMVCAIEASFQQSPNALYPVGVGHLVHMCSLCLPP